MIQGVVGKVFDRQSNGKTFYSLTINGVDGFYGTGMKRPPSPGTSVKFQEKKNAKGYLEVDGSIEVLADGQVAPAGNVGAVARSSGATAGNQSAYWDRKEARDIANDAARELGASRNTAIAFIDLALKNEVYKLPAAAKREEYLKTLLDRTVNWLLGKSDDVAGETAEVSNGKQEQEGKDDDWG